MEGFEDLDGSEGFVGFEGVVDDAGGVAGAEDDVGGVVGAVGAGVVVELGGVLGGAGVTGAEGGLTGVVVELPDEPFVELPAEPLVELPDELPLEEPVGSSDVPLPLLPADGLLEVSMVVLL